MEYVLFIFDWSVTKIPHHVSEYLYCMKEKQMMRSFNAYKELLFKQFHQKKKKRKEKNLDHNENIRLNAFKIECNTMFISSLAFIFKENSSFSQCALITCHILKMKHLILLHSKYVWFRYVQFEIRIISYVLTSIFNEMKYFRSNDHSMMFKESVRFH